MIEHDHVQNPHGELKGHFNRIIVVLMLLFNLSVEGLRLYSPDYYTIRELKMQKTLKTKQLLTVLIIKREYTL